MSAGTPFDELRQLTLMLHGWRKVGIPSLAAIAFVVFTIAQKPRLNTSITTVAFHTILAVQSLPATQHPSYQLHRSNATGLSEVRWVRTLWWSVNVFRRRGRKVSAFRLPGRFDTKSSCENESFLGSDVDVCLRHFLGRTERDCANGVLARISFSFLRYLYFDFGAGGYRSGVCRLPKKSIGCMDTSRILSIGRSVSNSKGA